MDKERIKFLDSAKGLAICLMVFAHAIAWNLADYQSVISINSTQSDKNLVAGLLWQFIYSLVCENIISYARPIKSILLGSK